MNRAKVNWAAERSDSTVIGSRSMGPAEAFPATSTSTVPPLTRNMNTEPPRRTIVNAVVNARSASGSDIRALEMVARISRRLPCSRFARSAPSRRATRIAAPMMGTARSTWKVVCAANWITTVCQLAAATSAPRLSSSFRPKSISTIAARGRCLVVGDRVIAIAQSPAVTRVFCDSGSAGRPGPAISCHQPVACPTRRRSFCASPAPAWRPPCSSAPPDARSNARDSARQIRNRSRASRRSSGSASMPAPTRWASSRRGCRPLAT